MQTELTDQKISPKKPYTRTPQNKRKPIVNAAFLTLGRKIILQGVFSTLLEKVTQKNETSIKKTH